MTIEPPPAAAPGFAGFLEARGAAGTLKAHALRLVGTGGGFSAAVEGLRWGLDEAVSRAVPEPEAGLASGILIGLRERVSRETADDFTVTGLTHVVAISGWNIALVAGIISALLRATALGRRPRSAIVVGAIVVYTILAGAEASVIRAAVMGGVVIVARESGRPSGAAAALGLACWGLLLTQPEMIDDIGLQPELEIVGLDPYCGYFHGLKAYGRPALALDLMEPFRPLVVDSAVLTAINQRMVTEHHFQQSGGSVALPGVGVCIPWQAALVACDWTASPTTCRCGARCSASTVT